MHLMLTCGLLSAVAGFVVAWTQTSHNYDVTFRALGWAYPVAKASAGAIQVSTSLALQVAHAALMSPGGPLQVQSKSCTAACFEVLN